jgi:DcmR-like sensory protein
LFSSDELAKLSCVSTETTSHDAPDHLLRHSVHFYDRPSSLIDRVCEYVREGFRGGDAAIIICTPEHLASVDACLTARGFDVADLRQRGQYVSLDAATTLEQFIVNGRPDRRRFSDVVGGQLLRTHATYPRVRAFGEMVAILWAQGKSQAALELEDLWNELLGHHPFSLMCAYSLDVLGKPANLQTVVDIAKLHGKVLGTVEHAA